MRFFGLALIAASLTVVLAPSDADAKRKGWAVKASELRTEPLPEPSGDLWVYSQALKQEIQVNIYAPNADLDADDADGSQAFDPKALAALNSGLRCKKSKIEREMDPRLYEILSIVSDHFGGKRIELTSGFRKQRNSGSRHAHASAIDFRIDGVSTRELWEFVQTLDTGGMGLGYYPRAGFVHVDFRAKGKSSYRWIDNKRGSKLWRSRRNPDRS